MESVILTTPFLLVIAISSLLSALVILIFKETKIVPFIGVTLLTAVIIISLFLGAELIEILIYVLIMFSLFSLSILTRFKKEV